MASAEQSVKAYIALGSNLGDRKYNLREAIRFLEVTERLTVLKVSSFLENPAVGGPPDSPAFLNAVVEVETQLPARELLDRLLRIEQLLGRQRREKWGPRTIDLDLLVYGDSVISRQDLTVPHPRLHERRFVLQPLAEIAPSLLIPGVNKTAAELLAELPA